MCSKCTKTRQACNDDQSNVTIDNGLSAIPNVRHIRCSSQAFTKKDNHDCGCDKKHDSSKKDDDDKKHHSSKKDDDCDSHKKHDWSKDNDDCGCDEKHDRFEDDHCGCRRRHKCGCHSDLNGFWGF